MFAALVLVPSLLVAQRRGGSGGFGRDQGDKYGGPGANNGGMQLSNGDVEDMSPLKLLIDKRKDLKLADDKVKALKELEGKVKDQVQPSFKILDSLRRELRNPPREEDRGRMMSARNGVMNVVTEIRSAYDASLKEALPLLNEEQQKKAAELVDKQKNDSEEVLKEKLGGGRGGRRG